MTSPPPDLENQNPLEIVLPDPSLVILCGPSGAGKSTFAFQQFRAIQVVSSDRCRALISDTEAFGPESSGRAFALLYETIRHRLALRRLTIADTTALERSSRARLLELAREFGIPSVMILLAVREEECIRRNTLRQRNVNPRVIARQQRLLRTALLSIASEPFHAVYVLNEDMLSRVTVRLASEPARGAAPAEGAAAVRPTPFEGWADPWLVGAAGDPAGTIGDDTGTAAAEAIRSLGSIPGGHRRAALAALTASDVDPRWILYRPSLPQPAPKQIHTVVGRSGRDRHGAKMPGGLRGLCDRLWKQGYRRLCLEAWPTRAEPVSLVVAREPYHAARFLGVEGWGAIIAGCGRALLDEASAARLLEQIVHDLDSAAHFSRHQSPLMVAQALAVWTREPRAERPLAASLAAPDRPGQVEAWGSSDPTTVRDGPASEDVERILAPAYFPDQGSPDWRDRKPYLPRIPSPDALQLWLTDLLWPVEPSDPRDPEFLWAIAETCDLTETFALPPRALIDLGAGSGTPSRSSLAWFDRYWDRPGWDVLLTRATRAEHEESRAEHERPTIGWECPPWKLSDSGDAIGGAEALRIWQCRKKAVELAAAARRGRPWRVWVAAAWSLEPLPEPGAQRDLFGP